jgi:hypothetical protein
VALSRQLSYFTFSSSSGGQAYYFDIAVDAQGLVSVRNIRSLTGPVTAVPDSVVQDIAVAESLVTQLVAESQADTGNLVFTGQTERTATIAPGVLNNIDYRVVYTPPDAIAIKTQDKTTTSFKAVTAAAYGTPAQPKTVGYVVLVATHQTGTMGGEVTFVPADGGLKQITFPQAFSTDQYRVALEPYGFFPVRVIEQKKTGFKIQLGYTLQAIESVIVGYDVFV